jgi:hypothetical protein
VKRSYFDAMGENRHRTTGGALFAVTLHSCPRRCGGLGLRPSRRDDDTTTTTLRTQLATLARRGIVVNAPPRPDINGSPPLAATSAKADVAGVRAGADHK